VDECVALGVTRLRQGWCFFLVTILLAAPGLALVNYPLSAPPPLGESAGEVLLTADGRTLVYTAAHDTVNVTELYRAPVDRSAPPVRISHPMTAGWVESFVLTRDEKHVIYRYTAARERSFELYGAAVDGRTPAVKLSHVLADNESIYTEDVALMPDGSGLVYGVHRAVDDGGGLVEVWFRSVDGGGPPVRLTPQLRTGRPINSFKVSPDGQGLVFVAAMEPDRGPALYRVDFDGPGVAVQLSVPTPPIADPTLRASVDSFDFTPDGSGVVYVVNGGDTGSALHVVPVDGSTASTRLTPLLPAGVRIGTFTQTQDGSRVVYATSRDHSWGTYFGDVYAVASDGSAEAVRITPVFAAGEGASFTSPLLLSPNGQQVVYRHVGSPGPSEAYLVPIDGSGAVLKVNGPLEANATLQEFRFSSDGRYTLYWVSTLVQGAPWFRLFSRRLDADSAAIDLNAPLGFLPPTSFEWPRVFTPDGRALYRVNFRRSLYSAPMDASAAPVRLSPDDGMSGSTGAPSLSADGAVVAFVASRFEGQHGRVYVTAPDGSVPAVAVDAPRLPVGAVGEVQVSPDSRWVVYWGNDGGVTGLYARPIRPDAVPVLLAAFDGGRLGRLVITPDSKRVVFTAVVATGVQYELYAVPIDGASAPLRFNGLFGRNDGVDIFLVTPDGAHAVYAPLQRNGRILGEVYRVALDGTSPPVAIFPPMQMAAPTAIRDLSLTPDGQYALFLAPEQVSRNALRAVRVDGSGSPSVWRPAGRTVEAYRVAPDGRTVLLLALRFAASASEQPELFATAVDGSGSLVDLRVSGGRQPVSPDGRWFIDRTVATDGSRLVRLRVDGTGTPEVLDGPLAAPADFADAAITNDGARVVYRVTRGTGAALFSRALEGPGPAVRLPVPAGGEGAVTRFALSPDSRRVVAWTPSGTTGSAIWSVPVDGTDGAVWLVRENAPADIQFAPDGRRVAYAVANEAVVSQPLDGRVPPFVLTPPFAPRIDDRPYRQPGEVRTLQVTPDSSAVVYVADQDASLSFRVWASTWCGDGILDPEEECDPGVDARQTRCSAACSFDGPTPTPTVPASGGCVGDCTGDGVVTVDEIVVGVAIGLGSSAVTTCPAFDVNADGSVTIEELVRAVDLALRGCG